MIERHHESGLTDAQIDELFEEIMLQTAARDLRTGEVLFAMPAPEHDETSDIGWEQLNRSHDDFLTEFYALDPNQAAEIDRIREELGDGKA